MLKRRRTKTKRKVELNLEATAEISEGIEERCNKSQKYCEEKERASLDSAQNCRTPTHKHANQHSNKYSKTAEKCHKDIHFAFLPERYEPLIEDDEETEKSKEEKRHKKKERNKKYRKNLGKALRFGWKCMVAGLQSFTAAYSTPISAAASFVSGFHETSIKG